MRAAVPRWLSRLGNAGAEQSDELVGGTELLGELCPALLGVDEELPQCQACVVAMVIPGGDAVDRTEEVGLGDVVAIVPMAALVAVMIMVSVGTFDWHSIAPSTLRRLPVSETIVMVVTVAVVVLTHNLAIGVIVGVLVASIVFVRRVAHCAGVQRVIVERDGGAVAHYTVTGELFFASSNDLTTMFEYAADPDRVIIDLAPSHIWDASSVAALDAITARYGKRRKTVEIVGMNADTSALHGRLSGVLGAGH